MRLYVIGDIHGHLDQLRAAHDRVFRDGGRNAQIAHVGDLIDRGPDSRGVVEYLMQGQMRAEPWVVTRGNHDRFLPKFLRNPEWLDPGLRDRASWLDHPGLGAAETLQSYGVDTALPPGKTLAEARRAVPANHADYLASLPLYFLHPLALVVHAGIRPGVDLSAQTEQDLLWIRREFLDSRADHGILVAHGHTAIDRAAHFGNRLNVDGGAAYGRPLCAVVIEDGATFLLTDAGRIPLHPEAMPCD